MTLHTYQHQLAHWLKQPADAVANPAQVPYWQTLSEVGGLTRVQQVALFWRRQQFSNFCPITYVALIRLGLFEEIISTFYAQRNVSAYVEQAGRAFLDYVAEASEGLLRSVALFERAELDVRTGIRSVARVDWPVDPHMVLRYLLNNEAVDLEAARGTYQTLHQTGQDFVTLT